MKTYTITYDVVNNIGELKVFYFDENDSRKQLGRKFSGLFEDADDKNVNKKPIFEKTLYIFRLPSFKHFF